MPKNGLLYKELLGKIIAQNVKCNRSLHYFRSLTFALQFMSNTMDFQCSAGTTQFSIGNHWIKTTTIATTITESNQYYWCKKKDLCRKEETFSLWNIFVLGDVNTYIKIHICIFKSHWSLSCSFNLHLSAWVPNPTTVLTEVWSLPPA